MKSMSRWAGGVTLVELLVCLALVGILLGVALPAYREHIRRVHRVVKGGVIYDPAALLSER